MKRKHFVLLTVLFWCTASIAMGAIVDEGRTDNFIALLEGDNALVEGGGSGWRSPTSDMQWFLYNEPTDPPQPNPWWNQWFYDHPPTVDRWKIIKYKITVDPLLNPDLINPQLKVNISLNWSTMAYGPTGPDGSPPMSQQEEFIRRQVIFPAGFILAPGQPVTFDGRFDIKDFNPEWVSIDVFAEAWGTDSAGNPVPMQVRIDGEVYHACVPEPATLMLMGFGALALLKKRS